MVSKFRKYIYIYIYIGKNVFCSMLVYLAVGSGSSICSWEFCNDMNCRSIHESSC